MTPDMDQIRANFTIMIIQIRTQTLITDMIITG